MRGEINNLPRSLTIVEENETRRLFTPVDTNSGNNQQQKKFF